MAEAPFYDDVADGPRDGSAHWCDTSDGVRIRVGHWPNDAARGSVLIFPGRTEYIEKYGRAAQIFHSAGYAVAAIDWRGQGLADRLHDDPGMGHVLAFPDYQHDVAAMWAHCEALDLPKPWHLVAHSMGGAIGLRALMNHAPITSVMFSAPMWGIYMSRALRFYATAVTRLGTRIGQGHRVVPGQSTEYTFGDLDFATNLLTHDEEYFAHMQAQGAAHPDLTISGPSILWLHEALEETRVLHGLPSPAVPALTFLGSDELIVDHDRIRQRMARWADGALIEIDGGKHEMMMEVPAIRDRLYAETIAHFDAHTT